MNLIKTIREGNLFEAKEYLFGKLDEQKEILEENYRKWLQSTYIDEARFKIVRVKVRRGKVLRRHKIATAKNYTFRGGKLTRMSQQERRNRRISQRRGKVKRRAKLSRSLVKKKRSLRKLKVLGGGKR